MKAPIITLLLRDGTLYFLLILFMNVAEIMVETVNGASALSPVSEFLALIPPILISRFLLNLRQIDNDDDEEAEVTHVSTLGFRASVSVGNMGESLDHGPAEYDDARGEPEDSFDDPIDHSVDANNEVYSLSEITPR
ncbi:hypothetical protein EW026_g6455 [Hermanssonia centrifuga]|uniref:Uncharacterized protein n=1 Tax=Hermanssonia centrifuga TaxID=98765 RepID=A0A4S4KB02_9APHY|nr:hypothetical protein EW026_g6455 [Hermanssonia centrifuga]